jgi:stalled ribosome rescue protein Dom34
VVHDSRYTERETHQLREYYDRLADKLRDADAIVLFGPAGTNSDFKKRLDEEYPAISARIQDVLTADSMTSNQVQALIREYFES